MMNRAPSDQTPVDARAFRSGGTSTIDVSEACRLSPEVGLRGMNAPCPIADPEGGHLEVLAELATIVNYELRRPVASAAIFTAASERWLAAGTPDLVEAHRAIAGALEATRHVARVVECMATLVLKTPSQARPVLIEDVVIDAARSAQKSASRLAPLEVCLGASGTLVMCDEVLLRRTLTRLLTEALLVATSTPARSIHLSTAIVDGRVRVGVEDRGHMPATRQFEAPFFRTGGLGMEASMSMCRAAAVSSGGALHMEEPPRGKSARICMLLPVLAADAD